MGTYKGIQGYSVQSLASDPTAEDTVGQLFYNSASNVWKVSIQGSGSWATGGTLNTARTYMLGGAGATGSAGLAFTGQTGPSTPAYVTLAETYNGTAWTEVNNLHTARQSFGGFGSQTSAICAGGYASGGANASVESYNGTSWTETTNISTTRYASTGIGQANTSGLIACGNGGLNATEVWNGSTWTTVAATNHSRQYAMGAGQGTITAALLFGGEPATANNESYNGTAWTEVSNLTTGRYLGGSAGIQTSVLCFGGRTPAVDSGATLSITEKWDGTSWTEVGDMALKKGAISNSCGLATDALCYGGGNTTTPSINVGTDTTEEWSAPNYESKTVTTS